MLNDTIKITEIELNRLFKSKQKNENPKAIYQLYIKLENVITNTRLVADHYLALDFTEEYLQNSSWGKQEDKWRKFLNKDLESLNTSLKKYLLRLNFLQSYSDEIADLFNQKTYYGFVRDRYNVGLVDENCILKSNTLNLEIKERLDISKKDELDLSTYEQRVALQNELHEKMNILKEHKSNLKQYIIDNYLLLDLVN